tara:strand:- start:308 stop:913 length:606 start_codon:yes stop_codon:yes gene_type:complete
VPHWIVINELSKKVAVTKEGHEFDFTEEDSANQFAKQLSSLSGLSFKSIQKEEKKEKHMRVKIKKTRPDAVIPKYSKLGDAGMDLHCVEVKHDRYGSLVCHTGLAMEIPEGYVGLLFPRSSISKTNMSLCNSVGVVDSGYRGEIMLKFNWEEPLSFQKELYKAGDRVGQIIIIPHPSIEFIQTEKLSETDRGEGGFGSTGT